MAARRTVKTTGQKPSQRAPLVARSPRTKADRQAIATATLGRLSREYPNAHCELDFQNPFELTVATILSAQCTDVRVNMVTPTLFGKYPTAQELAKANDADVEEIIKSTGFFRAKTKSLLSMAATLTEQFHGEVPKTLPELITLGGVGRKTANVVLGNAFNINAGIVVDTHVQRLTRRLGLTREADAVAIEQALIPLFPRDSWTLISHLLIWHGRRVCLARKPLCGQCVLQDVCPSAELNAEVPSKVAPD
ncbi:MAG: endonuclease III [Gemmatimonadaceae bacterium]